MPNTAAIPLDMSLFRPGMRVAVAVSGGADSVALLLALLEQAPQHGLVLSVAHVNHGLRAEESDADEEFVRKLARCPRSAIPLPSLRCVRVGASLETGIEETATGTPVCLLRFSHDRPGRRRGHRSHPRRPGGDGAHEVVARGLDRRIGRHSSRAQGGRKGKDCSTLSGNSSDGGGDISQGASTGLARR